MMQKLEAHSTVSVKKTSSCQQLPSKHSHTVNTISKNQNQIILPSTSICMYAYMCTHTYMHTPFSPKLK